MALDTDTGAGNVVFSSTLNGTTAATESLTVTAGTGSVTFTGAVGGSTTLNDVTVTADAITVASTFAVGGDITFTADSIDLNGGADSVSGTRRS